MRRSAVLSLKTAVLIVLLAAVLFLGMFGDAGAVVVTLDQMNNLRAGLGLAPLQGNTAADIPMLAEECERGIESSCTILQALIEQFAPEHPPVIPGPDGAPPEGAGERGKEQII